MRHADSHNARWALDYFLRFFSRIWRRLRHFAMKDVRYISIYCCHQEVVYHLSFLYGVAAPPARKE